jgi:uncharacterized membrane protein YeaQ/YmgE (transglycosylase-associated protein family)
MLNYLWWFIGGPIAGWLTGRLMRSPGWGGLDLLAGLVGGIVGGTLYEIAGFNPAYTPLSAAIVGAAGGIVVTFIFRKIAGRRPDASAPKQSSGRGSYTSYKSRMGK